MENLESLDMEELENIHGGWTPAGMFTNMGFGAVEGAVTGGTFAGAPGAIVGTVLGTCYGAVKYAVTDYAG